MKMVQVKTSELSGVALDWAVAKCEGRTVEIQPAEGPLPAYWEGEGDRTYWYSADWAQGGPIIEREDISLAGKDSLHDFWTAMNQHWGHRQDGSTPLISAMRCYVTSKLGDSVEIPSVLF